MSEIIEVSQFSGDAEKRFLIPNAAAMDKLPKPGTPYSPETPNLVAAQVQPKPVKLADGTMLVTVRYVRKA